MLSLREKVESLRQDEDENSEQVTRLRTEKFEELMGDRRRLKREKEALEVERDANGCSRSNHRLKQQLEAQPSNNSITDINDISSPTVEQDSGSGDSDSNNDINNISSHVIEATLETEHKVVDTLSDAMPAAVRAATIANGFTGLQLASILGCDNSQVSRWRKSGKLAKLGWGHRPSKIKGRFEYFRIDET